MVKYFWPFLLCGLIVSSLITSSACAEQGWGSLTGRFQFDGPAPDDEPIVVDVNERIQASVPIYDERLIVNPDGMGLVNVAIWLNTSREAAEPPIHPDYLQSPDEPRLIMLDEFQIRPHVATVWTTRLVEFMNKGEVAYNTRIAALNPENASASHVIPTGRSNQIRFKKSEVLPVRVDDNIYPWMSGWLIVKEHPSTAATNVNGAFRIEKIPAGKWTFRFWH
jgi:hypothetical protein